MNSTFTFVKHELQLEQGYASFFYRVEYQDKTYNFTETITFPVPSKDVHIDDQKVQIILDNLLLMLGVSYWKAFCSEEILTPTISLSQDQAEFWNIVYTKGLGEFFYKNNLNFHNLINFPVAKNYSQISKTKTTNQPPNRSLLLFGGGKDSIVSAELLKKADKPFDIFIVNPTEIHLQTAKKAGVSILSIKRKLDPQLLELNSKPGVLNGHIPATAIIDFLAIFIAQLLGYSNIIASNEHSANFGNVTFLDEEINHQWSKSFEFEKLLQQYVKDHITENIHYFSLLRPFHEIQVVQEFVKYPKYFSDFSSCNRNFRLTQKLEGSHWCGECPKCLFVFILLSAFLPKNILLEIFNKDLYEDYSLLQIFRELLGIDLSKPFECVGTPEEVKLALLMAFQTGSFANDLLMVYFIQEILSTIRNEEELKHTLLKATKDHTMPEEFRKIVYEA